MIGVIGAAGVYTLSSSASVTYTSEFNISSIENTPYGIAFNDSGSKIYVTGDLKDAVIEFDLPSPYVISGSTLITSQSVSSQSNSPIDLHFNNDGSELFVFGFANDRIYKYDLSIEYDITTMSFTTSSILLNTQESDPWCLEFSPTGDKFYLIGQSQSEIFEYDLGTNFDITDITYSGNSFDVPSINGGVGAVCFRFNNDGTKLFVLSQTEDSIFEYSLSIAYDLSTPIYSNREFSIALEETSPSSFLFNNDGTKLFVIGFGGDAIIEYALSVPYTLPLV